MSLLTTDTRVLLYHKVHEPDAQEYDLKAFWQHITSKEFFTEEEWVFPSERLPSSHRDAAPRRAGFKVSTLNPMQQLQILFICEITRKDSSPDSVEAQVQEACEACVKETGKNVWAMAAIGTKAKLFCYTTKNEFTPLTAEYIDADQPEAQKIRDAFARMKLSATSTRP